MSRVKAQQKCLFIKQARLDPREGGFRDDRPKREGTCESGDIEQVGSDGGL